MKTVLTSAAAALLGMSTLACAGNYGEAQTTQRVESQISASVPDFSQLDTDGNGALTANEAENSPELASQWKEYDENEDGRLNRAEFSAFEKTRLEERAKQYEDSADEAEDRIDSAQ